MKMNKHLVPIIIMGIMIIGAVTIVGIVQANSPQRQMTITLTHCIEITENAKECTEMINKAYSKQTHQ